jgi:Flp pilus assembly pilin Flp
MIRAGTTSDNEDRTYASVDKGLQSSQLHGVDMVNFFRTLWRQEEGQDIAEYAVMLAVILVLVVGTVRLIGGNANNAFSATASAIAQ